MAIKKKLDNLFKEWEDNDYHRGKFVRDGIFDDNEYLNSNVKVMFLLKETNDFGSESQQEKKQEGYDLIKIIESELELKKSKPFVYRILEWSYCILTGFCDYNCLYKSDDIYNKIKQTAIVNIKKTGGKNRSKNKELLEYIRMNNNEINLMQEISIINPDIIISGLNSKELLFEIFKDIKFHDSGFCRDIARYKNENLNFKIIDYFHPSSRIPCEFTFCLLRKIIVSEGFKEL